MFLSLGMMLSSVEFLDVGVGEYLTLSKGTNHAALGSYGSFRIRGFQLQHISVDSG